jgi:ribosomal-protein-serine acetyltransferase
LTAVRESIHDLTEWLPWAHQSYGRRDALIFLRDSISAWGEGRAYDFAIRFLGDPGRHLGNVSVWFTSKQSRIGEVGYWIHSAETGKGIGTEATARIIQVAFEELEMHRVTLRIAVGNRPSERIAEKLGFTREGLLRDELQIKGRWVDHTVWGLLDDEYTKLKEEYEREGWLEPS